MIKANDVSIKTWIGVPENSDFPIQNIPFGVAKINDEVLLLRESEIQSLTYIK